MPEEYDRLNQMRYLSLAANIEGEDLGRVSTHLDKALADAGELPRGSKVDIRGQVTPMLEMFHGLAVGLGLAVVVVFLMLTAYFQSVRLALVATATAPAVVAGVAVALYLTNTTLNIESFMGAIMAVGVAVANAILLVTFAERNRQHGQTAAARRPDRGPRTAAAHLDDQLRDDRRHGADGPGLGRRRRADRAAGPGRHRRPGGRHLRHAAGSAGDLRHRPRQEQAQSRLHSSR